MQLKSLIAFIMGLVIQLTQVQMSVAEVAVKSCGNDESMCCCAGRESCPCAKEGKSDQKPAPLAPVSVDLKLLVSNTSEPDHQEVSVSPSLDKVCSNTCRLESKIGYAGVPLSVAFCSFVI